MSSYPGAQSQSYTDWLRGWKQWAKTRKRGRMAQFIIEKLEEGKQAKWLSINKGLFELTEWHMIAKEWFGEKPRNSEEVDAPCMLRKGLPRAFPGLEEVKEKSRKEGTQYRSRVFQASPMLMQEVFLHINSHGASYYPQQGHTGEEYSTVPGFTYTSAVEGYSTSAAAAYYQMVPQIKSEYPTVSHNHVPGPELPGGIQLGNGESTYLHQTQSYTNNDIDTLAEVIASGDSMETTGGAAPSYQIGLSNGWGGYSSSPGPASTNVLSQHQIPNSPPVYSAGGATFIGSPSQNLYHSPHSAHSPRISPEPTHSLSTSSYPPSVVDLQSTASTVGVPGTIINNGPVELSPPTTVQSPIVTDEVMEVKAVPNSSSMEGGGYMALIFYQPLPRGQKTVYFISTTQTPYYQLEQAVDENTFTLSCQIPKYPYAEEVELRVYCDQQHIASTTFRFYQNFSSSPEVLLQLLNSQLQSQFHMGSGTHGGVGAATGGASGQATYNGGYVPSSMYQLLLGACRLGCEPLVYSLLCSPIMENITGEQLKEAEECATSNGHMKLADHLNELYILHDMTPSPTLLCRCEGRETHVPAWYDEIDQLDQGGDTPQERAETVMNQIMAAITKAKDQPKEDDNKNEEVIDDITPTVEAMATLSVNEPLGSPTEKSPKRRLSSTSRLIRQTNSISDDNDKRAEDSSPPASTDPLSPTRRESADQISDLPVQHSFKKLPLTQMSDADSAIGLSFDEESLDTRRRSSLQNEFGSSVDVQGYKLSPTVGMEVANALDWESVFLVNSDFSSGDKKIFHKGDQIVQIGDHSTREMSAKDFGEILQTEATNGTTLYFISGSSTERSFPERLLHRTPSDQSLLASSTRVSQLLNTKASNQRTVVVSSPSIINVIGGKTVGMFVNDVRGLSQISQGDQILYINGRSVYGLSLYDVNQILSKISGSFELIVAENKGKFSSIRDQVELDSFYVRSLIDHTPANSREMTLKKGMLLRVVNTFSYQNYWLAWNVDEASGAETSLKKIPAPQNTQKQAGPSSLYERVHYSKSTSPRPVFVIGAKSDAIVSSMCSKSSQLKQCHTTEDILRTYSEGTHSPIASVLDVSMIQLLSGLQPIVLQVSYEGSPVTEQVDISSRINIDAIISESSSDREALQAVHRIQSQPVWRPAGLIH
ncbi:PREDICTED: uncharacterized protein LOC105313719 isoform X3 [Amphimedon queenslandica]|uniref:PDZ domain-containing protein n=1 Tax=Amphimedon queenslandica TaxID=400682 RepID=A0AAN0JF06_AMPQE|nr:PREDICTED: uncharacterized protein LOC105313719 isoform X3 [Amphimedon queenslandica]|eukprot:XP_019855352.1 PREDICTED: uncharacterized protein LOC105313719 isoform X3 [Amphimedon queenslandica]